jgi:hypothetical protein
MTSSGIRFNAIEVNTDLTPFHPAAAVVRMNSSRKRDRIQDGWRGYRAQDGLGDSLTLMTRSDCRASQTRFVTKAPQNLRGVAAKARAQAPWDYRKFT